jgi:hypothetical protein
VPIGGRFPAGKGWIQPVVHSLPGLPHAGKWAGMKSFLVALMTVVAAPVTAIAENPLTATEQHVCRSLEHCLSIVEAHPHDSFDYVVLAEEFRRFGTNGRDALLQKISKDDENSAHAADLLALTRDASALPRLRGLQMKITRTEDSLVARTLTALEMRLSGQPDYPKQSPTEQNTSVISICPKGTILPFEARQREMPFFELDVATPDMFGAYRPSAQFQLPLHYASRGWLRSARPVPGGWLAGYPDGLVHYDSRTGAPRLRMKGQILSVQAQQSTSMTPDSWAFILNDNNQTYIVDIDQRTIRLARTSPGPLTELRRGQDGTLYASSAAGQSVTLRTDGSVVPGCGMQTP